MGKPHSMLGRMLTFALISFFLVCVTAVNLPLARVYGWCGKDELQISPSSGPEGTSVTVNFDIKSFFYNKYKDSIGYEWHRDHMWETYVDLKFLLVWDISNEDINLYWNPGEWNIIGEAAVDYKGLLWGHATIPKANYYGEHSIHAVYEHNDEDYHSWWCTRFTVTEHSDNDGNGPKCLAMAAYGGSAGEVVYMRRVRDDLIGSTDVGRVLVGAWNTFYYLWSPFVAGLVAKSNVLQSAFRVLLAPLLGVVNIAEQEYRCLAWLNPNMASITAFMTAALLAIAIYIVLPTLIVRIMIRHGHSLFRIMRRKHKIQWMKFGY